MPDYESIWNGKDTLVESLERDPAAMHGDGWDPWYLPPSPLTTPWEKAVPFARPDPEAHVSSALVRRTPRRRRPLRIVQDWQRTYTGAIDHVGSKKGHGS